MDILDQSMQFIDENKRPIEFYKSMQSCQLWWCSEGRFGPGLVKRATSYQVSTLKSIREIAGKLSKEKQQAMDAMLNIAEKLLYKINYLIEVKTFVK